MLNDVDLAAVARCLHRSGLDGGARLHSPGDLPHLLQQRIRVFGRHTQLLGGKGQRRLFHFRQLVDLPFDLCRAVGAIQVLNDVDPAHTPMVLCVFVVMVVMLATTTGLSVLVVMMVVLPAAAGFPVLMVVMVMLPAATGLSVLMVMMVVLPAAAGFPVLMVMVVVLPAATRFSVFVVMMVMLPTAARFGILLCRDGLFFVLMLLHGLFTGFRHMFPSCLTH